MDAHGKIARRVYFVSACCSALVISTTFYLETRVSHVMFPAGVGYAFVALGQAQPILGVIGAWRRGRTVLFLFWSISTFVVIVSFIFICVWLALYAEIRVAQYECNHGIGNRTQTECNRVKKFNLDVQKGALVFLGSFFLMSVVATYTGKRFYDRVIIGRVALPDQIEQRNRIWKQDPLLSSRVTSLNDSR